jgi:DNA-binding transcriptional ArsR family regulator
MQVLSARQTRIDRLLSKYRGNSERSAALAAKKKKPRAAAKARKPAAKKPRQAKKDGELVDQRLMKALAHSLRVRCLALMTDRPWSPRELSDELGEGLSQVSYHVTVLKDFELIELVETVPRRGAVEHFYRTVERVIIPEGLSIALPKSARLGILGDILQDIFKEVDAAIAAATFYAREDFHASLTPMDLDEQACKDVAVKVDRLMGELLDVQGEATTRFCTGESDPSERFQISAAIMVFGADRGPGEEKAAKERRRG